MNGWAEPPVERLKSGGVPEGAVDLNVEGRQITGPLHGFGPLWKKTYRVRLSGSPASPREVIRAWKAHFPEFWPRGNHFYSPMDGIVPGSVAVLNLAGPGGMHLPGGAPVISTGVMVVFADEESFSFITPQGHMFAGMITFSAWVEDGQTVAQAQALVRTNDPLYELSFRLGFGQRSEDEFWLATLRSLAAYFGVRTEATQQVMCIDPAVRWQEAGNIWQNAAIRTLLYSLGAPVRGIGRLLRR